MTTNPNENELLITIDMLCEQLQIGLNTAYSLLRTGEIKSFKIGRIYKIPQYSVYEYINRKCQK